MINKSIPTNTTRVNVNYIHKQQQWKKDVYIYIHLEKARTSECIFCPIKCKPKLVSELVKVQSVMYEDAVRFKRVIVVWKI